LAESKAIVTVQHTFSHCQQSDSALI